MGRRAAQEPARGLYQVGLWTPGGNPVVAYSDGANDQDHGDGAGTAAVERRGQPRHFSGWAYDLSLALDAGGNPVVAYCDEANGYKTTVLRWDGSS
ncbi:MAG: hypothetical protein U0V45_05095 [Flavobacteriales bacterium]